MRNWNNKVGVLIAVLHCCIVCANSLQTDSNKTTIDSNHRNGEGIMLFGSSKYSRVKRQYSIPIDAGREKLLQDAMSWLSLRSGGKLLSTSELQPYYDEITDKYSNSKAYQTLVIAFQFGVLPKLTLKENDKCDHSFMKTYRDPHNNSFTYYYQKKFIFDNYAQLKVSSIALPGAYCDYRQGLICNPLTSKCECPEGGKMDSVQTSPPTQRCVLGKDIECTLADLTHDKNRDHSALDKALYHLIFNLEKPISCTTGTVCRVGLNEGAIFRCHDASNSNWWNGKTLKNMDECTIDAYVTPGRCGTTQILGGIEDLVCYDYGPRAKPEMKGIKVAARTGFCTRKYGATLPISTRYEGVSYGRDGTWVDEAHPLLLTFVNPRTVPLRGDKFRTYQDKLRDICKDNLYQSNPPIGKACSVAKNTKILEMWKFYQSLDNDPPAGQDFVATEAELEAKLTELTNIFGVNGKKGVCKMYWDSSEPFGCISTGSGDVGTCQKSTNPLTKSYADKLKSHLAYNRHTDFQNAIEEQNIDTKILWQHPDPPNVMCAGNSQEIPGPPTGSSDHKHVDILPGNLCPSTSVCYEDLYDDHGIYDKGNCSFRSGYKPIYVCHETSLHIDLETCEKTHIEKRTLEMWKHFKLGWGSKCNHEVEKFVRDKLIEDPVYPDYGTDKANPYLILSMMELTGAKIGFCDATKLLECIPENICECVDDTVPRVSNDGRTQSDYCYLSSGRCDKDMTSLIAMTDEEKKAVKDHYAYENADSDCKARNTCALLQEKSSECAVVEVKRRFTTTTGSTGKKKKKGSGKPGGIGSPEKYGGAGGIRDTDKILLLIFMLIVHLSFY